MVTLIEFLERNVEEYLFKDLERMAGIQAAFPMTMSALAGVELLGTLLSTTPFTAFKGYDYFTLYWTGPLYGGDAAKARTAGAIYQLVRHGIAHIFAPKGPITISLVRSSHLTETSPGSVNLDARQLADDLVASYWSSFKPVAEGKTTYNGATAATMAKQLADIAASYAADVQKHLQPGTFAPMSATTVAHSPATSSATFPSSNVSTGKFP